VRSSGSPTSASLRTRAAIAAARQALRVPGRQSFLLASLVFVCLGVALNGGYYSPAALICELLAIPLLAVAYTAEDRPVSRWWWLAVIAVLAVCDLMYTFNWSPLEAVFLLPALASVALVARAKPNRRRLRVALAAACVAVAGTVIVGFHAGVGRFDVFY
jgi:hypothetical protein